MRHTEGEANTSAARADWVARETQDETRDLPARDVEAVLHQSLSSPCLSTIARAEGIWIEDASGRRFTGFHGNSRCYIPQRLSGTVSFKTRAGNVPPLSPSLVSVEGALGRMLGIVGTAWGAAA